MLNKEYYKDLLVEFAVNDEKLALMDGVPSKCDETPCAKCGFDDVNVCCVDMRKRWANKEYTEPRIHWEDVPVDTPVYVNTDDRQMSRHFASYDVESKLIKVFNSGRTSFTISDKHNVDQHTAVYPSLHVTLAREEDMKKYYHR